MTADAMDQIAEAVSASNRLAALSADIAQLTAVVQSSLAEQQRLNRRMDEQTRSLGEGLRDTRERLVGVEQLCCDLPRLKRELTDLRAAVARYVGMGAGAGIVISAVVSAAIALTVKFAG